MSVPDVLFLPLLELLDERVAVIQDHAWRDRDGPGHLAALGDVSGRISWEHAALQSAGVLPGRLEHYLSRGSFEKAAAWIREGGE